MPTTSSSTAKRRGPYARRSKQERRKLAMKVYELKIRGYSFAAIGQALGVPDSTATWLMREVSRVNDREFKDLTANAVAKDLFAGSQTRIQMLLALFRDTNNESVKLGCLNSIRAEHEQCVRHAQELGQLHKAPERHEIKSDQTVRVQYDDVSLRIRLDDLQLRLS